MQTSSSDAYKPPNKRRSAILKELKNAQEQYKEEERKKKAEHEEKLLWRELYKEEITEEYEEQREEVRSRRLHMYRLTQAKELIRQREREHQEDEAEIERRKREYEIKCWEDMLREDEEKKQKEREARIDAEVKRAQAQIKEKVRKDFEKMKAHEERDVQEAQNIQKHIERFNEQQTYLSEKEREKREKARGRTAAYDRREHESTQTACTNTADIRIFINIETGKKEIKTRGENKERENQKRREERERMLELEEQDFIWRAQPVPIQTTEAATQTPRKTTTEDVSTQTFSVENTRQQFRKLEERRYEEFTRPFLEEKGRMQQRKTDRMLLTGEWQPRSNIQRQRLTELLRIEEEKKRDGKSQNNGTRH